MYGAVRTESKQDIDPHHHQSYSVGRRYVHGHDSCCSDLYSDLSTCCYRTGCRSGPLRYHDDHESLYRNLYTPGRHAALCRGQRSTDHNYEGSPSSPASLWRDGRSPTSHHLLAHVEYLAARTLRVNVI